MGRRGPAPKPTELRLLHGDRRSRINTAEPRPRDLAPERPRWLTPTAVEEWDRVAPDLVAMGTVKAVDATALGCYCEAVARLRAGLAALAEFGLVLVDADGVPHRNPASGMVRDASNEVRLWAREFGLTPSARSPLKVDVAHHGLSGERLLT
jgi:P27 family predicted phage terminase small subunit